MNLILSLSSPSKMIFPSINSSVLIETPDPPPPPPPPFPLFLSVSSVNESDADERDVEAYITILSGDLKNNDVVGEFAQKLINDAHPRT